MNPVLCAKIPRFLVTANNPEAVIDVSVIFSTVIGLALPSTMLYYAVALLVCKLVFDRQVSGFVLVLLLLLLLLLLEPPSGCTGAT